MKKLLQTGAALMLCAALQVHAGFPADYGVVPFNDALARATKDGKAVMTFFSEDG